MKLLKFAFFMFDFVDPNCGQTLVIEFSLEQFRKQKMFDSD